MKKVKEQTQKVLDECHVIYNENGSGAVIDHVAKQQRKCNPDYKNVQDEICIPCDNDMPSLSNTCLVCGSETKPENYFPMSEIENFKNEWGQTHDEICSCLGYDKDDDGSSEMIMGDGYFWIEEDKKWYPKSSSMYNERQLTIADYLRNP